MKKIRRKRFIGEGFYRANTAFCKLRKNRAARALVALAVVVRQQANARDVTASFYIAGLTDPAL